MKKQKDNTLSYKIIIIILLGIGIYYQIKSQKTLNYENISSFTCEITSINPSLSEFTEYDDIKFKVKEFPAKKFSLSHLYINYEDGKMILFKINKSNKIIIDIEKNEVSKNTILGLQPTLDILGIRFNEKEKLPLMKYMIEKKSKNKTLSYLSLFGILIISLFLILDKLKQKLINTQRI